MKYTKFEKEDTLGISFRKVLNLGPHIGLTDLQFHKAWRVDSSYNPQALHKDELSTFLQWRFFKVGRALEQAHQQKIFILFGSFNFQIFFQKTFCVAVFKLEAPSKFLNSHRS